MLRSMLVTVLVLCVSGTRAQISSGERFAAQEDSRSAPKLINYQGYLTDTLGIPIDGTLDMSFKIYDAVSAGTAWWSETQLDIPVEKGIFHVMLGSVTSIPDSIFTPGTDRWLELTLEGGVTLTPRTQITSMGYAYMAVHSDTAEYAKNAQPDADWVITGSDMYSGVSGGVGIGATPSIAYRLNVLGGSNYAIRCEWNGSSLGSSILATTTTDQGDAIQAVANGTGRSAIWARGSSGVDYAVYAYANGATWAGYFNGDVNIAGDLSVSGLYPADTDWVISGSNMYSGVSGGVGIGVTPSSAYKLNVVGGSSYAIRSEWNGSSLGASIVATTTTDQGDALQVFANGTGRSAIWARGHTGVEYSIYSYSNGATWAGYFDGDVNITGDLSVSGNFPVDTDWVISGDDMYSGVSGNVGIGASTPIHKLHVLANVSNTAGTDGNFVDIENTNSSTDVMSGIRFANGTTDSTFKGGIFFQDKAGYGLGYMMFALNGTAAAGNVTAADAHMTISYNGSIGIGTTPSISNKLNVIGGSSYAIRGEWNGSSLGASILATTTTDQGDALQAFNNGTGRSAIYARGNTGVDYSIYSNANGATWAGYFDGDAYVSGNLGVGTTSPVEKLHVVGTDTLGSVLIAPNETGSGDDAEIILAEDNDNTYNMSIKYDGGDNRLYVYGKSVSTIYGPHMAINRTGNVGIGIAAPSYMLHVVGSGTAIALYSNSDAGRGGYFRNNNNDYYPLYAINASGSGGTYRGVYVQGHAYATGGFQTFMSEHRTGFALLSIDGEMVLSGSTALQAGTRTVSFDQEVMGAISQDVEIKVIATPTEQCNGLYIANKSATGFTVGELMNGQSNASFDWIAIVRLKGYEQRLHTEQLSRSELESM